MNSFSLYTKTSPLKLFGMVAIPGAVSMLASSLWGLFDGIFVGQILGETAFAAVNLAMPLVFINFSLADLVGVGSSVPISILLGKRQEREANNYFTCACLMILITGIAMGSILYVTAPFLIQAMGADGLLAELAVRYIRVYAICSPVTTIIFAVDNFLRICGRIKSSMILNIVMSALIMLLEFVCLFVLRMGVGGAALSVSLGMFLCAAVALYPFFRRKYQLKFCRPSFHLELVRRIIASGSPTFLSNIAARLTSIVMNVVLLKVGGYNAVSVYGVLMYVSDILSQLMYGTCDSLQPAIGYNWGAGETGRVKRIAKCCLAASAVISIGGAVLMFLFPGTIVSLFLGEGEQGLLVMAVHALRLFGIAYLIKWFGFSVQSLLIAIDRPVPATVLSVSSALAFPLLLIVVLWPLQLDGLWLNYAVTSALVSLLACIMLFFIKQSKAETD